MAKGGNQICISLPAAIAIGIGGMIGAGIFSILGVVAVTAGNAMWLSFLCGGIVALFSTYSYAKLGAKFPSAGGPVQFLVQSYGDGVVSGSINIFMWLGYIISLALYAHGFAAYFLTFFPHHTTSAVTEKMVACAIIILFSCINILGARSVGKTELFIVSVKVCILILFAACGIFYIKPDYLSPTHWKNYENIFYGAGILFIGYEGFGLITNAAANIANPKKTLPRALYLSVFIVIAIYIAIAIVVSGTLTTAQIAQTQDYALAEAAKPFLGMFGFKLISIAALFSTASAINATLFGGANICYMLARDHEMPAELLKLRWHGASGGLFITTVLVLLFIIFFNLAGVAMMGSGAFLLIYAAVNTGHLRIIKQTGANKFIVIMAIILCLMLFTILEIYTYQHAPLAVYTMIFLLVGSVIAERVYRKFIFN